MNKSVMKCCICNNENIGQFITINNKKYHLCCIEQLQQENKRLKIQVSAREEVANKYKKVIDEAREYTKKEIREYKYAIDETTMDSDTEDIYDMAIRNFEKLLQILDKAKY